MERKTKITCTIGPASESEEILSRLIAGGMDVARLNFSHGNHEEHLNRVRMIRRLAKQAGRNVAIMLDTKGPEMRTGLLKDKTVTLREGNQLVLTTRQVQGDESTLSVSYEGLPTEVSAGDTILLDDGLIALNVLETTREEIRCEVLNGGEIAARRGINVPGRRMNLPFISDKDREDIDFAMEHELDYVALSFVYGPQDVRSVRRIIDERNNPLKIIAKIENVFAVETIEDIVDVSDGIMVARGDLGVEIPFEEIPMIQKRIIRISYERAKPVITATQMLDSMIRNPRPTRAEVTDVANAILDGTDSVMLSGESAAGLYPVQSLQTMVRIANETEKIVNWRKDRYRKGKYPTDNPITDSISKSAVRMSDKLNAKAIVVPSYSGFTVRMVAKYRPHTQVIAAIWDPVVRRQMALLRGVTVVDVEYTDDTDRTIMMAIDAARKAGHLAEGDVAIVTAGIPSGLSGKTNLIKVHVV